MAHAQSASRAVEGRSGATNKGGAVGRAIHKLLTGERKHPLSYGEIAERVRAKVPGAHTTARSVASVASAMRAAGAELPDRRQAH